MLKQPLPQLIVVLDVFGCDNYFNAFDLQDGFWWILLHIYRHKTAFAAHNVLLEWTVNPQGSKEGALAFSLVIQNIMRDRPPGVEVCQDDIFPHSSSILSLLDGQHFMSEALSAHNVTVRRSKMLQLNFPPMKCLGYIATSSGRRPDPEKVQAIADMEIPKSHGGLLCFNGLVTFSKDYIKGLSDAVAGTTLPAQSFRRASRFTDITIPKCSLRLRNHRRV